MCCIIQGAGSVWLGQVGKGWYRMGGKEPVEENGWKRA